MSRKVIAVKVRILDVSDGADFESWARNLYNILREAGIPATPDGYLERGTIRRYDDPASWDSVIYEWWDEGYNPAHDDDN